jgi:hypothetical protein
MFLAVVFMGAATAQAGVIHSETFDTDGNIDDYTGAGKIFSETTKSGSTADGVISGGVLTMNGGDDEILSRIDLGGTKTLLSIQFDVRGDTYSATSNGAWGAYTGSFDDITDFVGHQQNNGNRNWSTTWNTDSNVIAEDDSGTQYSDTITIGTFHTWTIYLNQSGGTESFVGPDGSSHNLGTDRWSFFHDNTLVADSVARGTNGGYDADTLSGIIFTTEQNHSGATSITSIDNIVIRDDLNLIPEPSILLLLGLGLAGVHFARRSCRSNTLNIL